MLCQADHLAAVRYDNLRVRGQGFDQRLTNLITEQKIRKRLAVQDFLCSIGKQGGGAMKLDRTAFGGHDQQAATAPHLGKFDCGQETETGIGVGFGTTQVGTRRVRIKHGRIG